MPDMLETLQTIIADRQANPQPGSYTNKLLDKGREHIAQKVGEEGVEVVIAGLLQDDEALLGEFADLMYHLSVLLTIRGLTWEQVNQTLAERHAP